MLQKVGGSLLHIQTVNSDQNCYLYVYASDMGHTKSVYCNSPFYTNYLMHIACTFCSQVHFLQ